MFRVPALLLAASLTGCSGSSPEPQPPASLPSAPSDASADAPSAKPVATAAAEPASPGASTKPPSPGASAGPKANDGFAEVRKHSVDGADGVRRWATWTGPKKGARITTKKAWVVAPNTVLLGEKPLSFSSVHVALVPVSKATDDEVIYELQGVKYATPAFLSRPAVPAKRLEKGAAIVCNFGQGSTMGRVAASSGDAVTCAVHFMGKKHETKLPLDEVLPVDGTLSLAARAFVRFEDQGQQREAPGVVLGADGGSVWVARPSYAGGPIRVPAGDVRILDGKPLAPGARCIAKASFGARACKVTQVLDGVGYRVAFDEGAMPDDGKDPVGLDDIVASPKE